MQTNKQYVIIIQVVVLNNIYKQTKQTKNKQTICDNNFGGCFGKKSNIQTNKQKTNKQT